MFITLYILGFIAYIVIGIIMGRIVYKQIRTVIPSKKIMIPFLIIHIVFVYVFPLCGMLSYFTRAGGILEKFGNIGFVFMAFLLYFLFYGVIIDLIYLLIVKIVNKDYIKKESNKFLILCIVIIGALITSICGVYEQKNSTITKINIGDQQEKLNVVCLSDVHYASFGSKVILSKMVNKINSLSPDIVLFIGDIIDNDIDNIDKENFIKCFNSIDSTYGSYAVTGNHELKYNTLDEIKDLYSQTNVRLLVDEEIIIDNKVKLIGRVDETYSDRRKNLGEIDDNSINLPIIVMDHQPQSYKESRDYGVRFQISGHTHNAQLYPLNLFVKVFYQINYNTGYINGKYEKGDFTSYITRGYGAWGFQMRTNGPSEIVNVTFGYK